MPLTSSIRHWRRTEAKLRENRFIRPNPIFASDDPELIRRLICENPFGTLVSHTAGGLVASHYPIMLDPEPAGLAVLSHVGRPDEELHELGRHEVMLIVMGHHGYISPSWYPGDGLPVPTWNFTVAHLYGTPRILSEEENLTTLARLVEHFERPLPHPRLLEDPEAARATAQRTVGFRLPVERFEAKVKLSQNKDEATRRKVIDFLRVPGPYQHVPLAGEMERVLEADHDPVAPSGTS